MENVNEERKKGESFINKNVHVIRSRLIETVYKYLYLIQDKTFPNELLPIKKSRKIEILIIIFVN